ncbi:MAG: TIGR02646 family protein [Chloroflexi bacterium]|nr:TIGR02646 family protein [Chloroflexota bacterium]
MKRIASLANLTPGLADYLAQPSDEDKNWVRFRDHAGGAAYRELVEELVNLQHGICGYCEIDIQERDRQVEHVIPQSDPLRGAAHALDAGNMIACCKGGTLVTDDETRRLDPVKRNRSCGEAKEDLVDADFVDPRTLPDLPSLTRVSFDGRIQADAASCNSCGIPVGRIEKTIEILGLNTQRLRRTRENHWDALSDNWGPEIDAPELMEAAAKGELLPDADNRLHRFFTTSRSYFGVYAESILSELPRDWI